MIVVAVVIAVIMILSIFACLKVSGDCSRAEEQQEINEKLREKAQNE